MSKLWWPLLLIVSMAGIWLPARSAPLYTKPDASAPNTTAPDAGTKNPDAAIIPQPPVLPSYETLIDGKPHRLFVTIDDHPSRNTSLYLDTLKAVGVKATIFIVAYPLRGYLQAPKYNPGARIAEQLKRALREGHVLGNHSVSHRLMCNMSQKLAEWEVGNAQDWVRQAIGIEMKFWRPPHGHICPFAQKAAAKRNLITIMWDVDDWVSSPETMSWIIKTRARRGNSSTVVLFHNDINKFRRFFKILPPR